MTLRGNLRKLDWGAALLCIWKPIAFANRALTGIYTRNAQIEKDFSPLCLDSKIFINIHCTYGQGVIVQSDHKPLKYRYLQHRGSYKPRKLYSSTPFKEPKITEKAAYYHFQSIYSPVWMRPQLKMWKSKTKITFPFIWNYLFCLFIEILIVSLFLFVFMICY